MNDKQKSLIEFNNGLHRLGKITSVLVVIALLSVPFIIAAIVLQ